MKHCTFKKNRLKKIILIFLLFPVIALAQVGINTTSPSAGSILDITSSDKGLLIPRVDIADLSTITPITGGAPTGLMVYNTNTTTGPGFVYWDSSAWAPLATGTGTIDWTLAGNAGTNPGVGIGQNYFGTSDAQDLVFGTAAAERMRLLAGGQVSINNPAPLAGDRFTVSGAADEIVINGLSSGSLGVGVYGENTTNGAGVIGNVGNGFGVLGLSVGNGLGMLGNNSGNGSGVQGQNSANGAGLVGLNNSNGVGLVAQNISATPITGLVVAADMSYFGTDVDDHTGAFGFSEPGPGSGVGVEGWGGWIGVLGLDLTTTGSPTTFGVFADGDSGASGVKAFTIDHPEDPANKMLKHFSMESNEVLNVYRGTVTFNSQGKATVELPEYYESINRNASFQLTAIGAPMPNLFIEREISNGSFSIAGGVADKKVSWTVTSERNDPYLQQYPEKRQNVVDKGSRRGKYFMPKLYNQPKEKGITYKPRKTKQKMISEEKISTLSKNDDSKSEK